MPPRTSRTYNSRQLALKLEKARNVKFSTDRLRRVTTGASLPKPFFRVLKKRGFFGKEQELATEISKTADPAAVRQQREFAGGNPPSRNTRPERGGFAP